MTDKQSPKEPEKKPEVQADSKPVASQAAEQQSAEHQDKPEAERSAETQPAEPDAKLPDDSEQPKRDDSGKPEQAASESDAASAEDTAGKSVEPSDKAASDGIVSRETSETAVPQAEHDDAHAAADGKGKHGHHKHHKKDDDDSSFTTPYQKKHRDWLPVFGTIAGLVLGAVLGVILCSIAVQPKPIAITEVSSSDAPNVVVAEYTRDNQTHKITAQDMIDAMGSNATKLDDGNYAIPGSDTAITVARNQILMAECDSHNITVTDDELNNYMNLSYGTTDVSEIAKEYNVSEDEIRDGLMKSAKSHKLYLLITGTTDDGAPEMPDSQADSKALGEYILNILGDNWDNDKGTWANTSNEYYSTLGADFDPSSATMEEATQVYQIAAQDYQNAYTNAYEKWSAYVNGLMSKVTITIYTIGTNQ